MCKCYTVAKCMFVRVSFCCVGMVPVTVDNADKPYAQDSNGWIEILARVDNPQLTVFLGFHEKAFLKQLQFEGTSCQILYV